MANPTQVSRDGANAERVLKDEESDIFLTCIGWRNSIQSNKIGILEF